MRFKGLGLGLGFVLLSAVALVAQYVPYYVLDGYGGVHAGGAAPVITPATSYFGWNIARDLVYVPVGFNDTYHGDGLLVLDGYGGVHRGGKLSGVAFASTPYFGFDIAKTITLRRIDPIAYGIADDSYADYTDNNMHTIAGPINLVLPSAGYVLVTGNVLVINATTTAGQDLQTYAGIGVNSTTEYDSASRKACSLKAEVIASNYNNSTVAVSRLFYFASSGTQRFYFLIHRTGGTGTLRPGYTCFNAVYVNKRYDNYSQAGGEEDAALAPSTLPGVSATVIK
jgi:hypothetical protein